MNFDKYSIYAPALVRVSLSLVFLWFGVNQLIDAETFIGYVPDFLGDYASMVVFLNGIFETFVGLLLIVGYYTRFVAAVLGFHLLSIAAGLGYNDIAVRDYGLALITFSVVLGGSDVWCLDKKLHQV